MTFVINERMPYSHSHRVAWPRPKTGDSVLLTFDFRSSRRGGRHHVRLEYQLPIRSENGTTSRSYSVIQLKVTHYYRSRLNTIRPPPLPPPRPPARRSLRPSDRTVLLVPVHLFKSTIAADRCWIAISIFYLSTHVHRHTLGDSHMWRHECGCISGSTLLYIHAHTSVHPSRLFFFFFFDHPRNEWSNYRYQLFNYVYRLKRFYLQYDSHSLFVLCVFCNY